MEFWFVGQFRLVRGKAYARTKSPVGAKHVVNRVCRPYGALHVIASSPTVKTVGYGVSSLTGLCFSMIELLLLHF